MDVCKENNVGLANSHTFVKRANQSATKANIKPSFSKKALADVGNIIHHSAKKNNQEIQKPSESVKKPEGPKLFNVFSEENKIVGTPMSKRNNVNRIPLSPISGVKVRAAINPSYVYDSDDEDMHDCCPDLFHDDFNNVLPVNLRFNSDDIDALAMFKAPKDTWERHWKDNLSTISDESDLNDFNVPFPSPEKIDFDLPFNEFLVPAINLDDSF